MRRIVLALMVLLLACPQVYAWQFITEDTPGTSAVKVPFYSTAKIAAGAGPAHKVQIKNTGDGTLAFSLHLYTSSEWRQTLPRAAATVGEDFYAVSDSVVTLGPDEVFNLDAATDSQGAHIAYVTRSVATTYKIAYE